MFSEGDQVHVTQDHSYHGSHKMRNAVVVAKLPNSLCYDYEIKRLDGVTYTIGEHWLRPGFVFDDFCPGCRRYRATAECQWCHKVQCDGCQKMLDGVCFECIADSRLGIRPSQLERIIP
jgi:hypothetical protein